MQYRVEINNQVEIYDINYVAKQAAGAVLLRVKNTVVLATVSRDDVKADGDFLPLTVQYVEKAYAAGKIPGGYIKRETKPGDFETLTSRIIDRSLRPLFPKGYTYPTQIVVFVLSADAEVDLQVVSLNAASMALFLSDIPVDEPVCGVRVGRLNDEFIINPTNSELEKSTLDLYVAGVRDELLMIEMRSIPSLNQTSKISNPIDSLNEIPQKQNMNEFDEELMLEAIEFAKNAIEKGSKAYYETFKDYIKPHAKIELNEEFKDDDLANFIKENYLEKTKLAINSMAKSERASELNLIVKEILQSSEAIDKEWEEALVFDTLNKFKRKIVREQIIFDKVRADGRGLKDVRPISIDTNILPMAHGSCLFTRGQTQALVVATLGGESDAQLSESLTEKGVVSERFMVNYNFPGFSVGEASPLRSPGRRELGHGNLAKRALTPSVDINNPEVIRLVSEILESNGSSSMATVCGGSLALRAAGVNTYKLIAGVAMGLVFEGDKHAVLTDIMGLEDHDGDMDFKVAGSRDGITALQMDIKLGGISLEVLKEALYQAKEAREHILFIMEEADIKIRVNESILPKTEIFLVDSNRIVDIIGQGGKTIKEIIDNFGVTIDLDRDKGEVKIIGENSQKVEGAKATILDIVNTPKGGFKKNGKKEHKDVNFEENEIFESEIKNITKFGAFIPLRDGVDGLLHISKFRGQLKEGDKVKVKVVEQKGNRISLELID
ncbi:polyribonucleotide nucleotidyltransferase [Campylobacter corcagiensis]|uniref:Polyribonucleotide nucleotidyltransferase n=1 Tax=Campylobacter corcagiensis TaxID=1448857 RepID=A0A7M1LGJ7_9BACT|nr:polyribonucleotide nucleotidyltransferase [Campylobacter corcagiensis]QKF64372.1 polynucleotide phosphorylase [Campylobacter corcagiensis]QOQ87441.1 polyribonucleotide nucleotidyltransferase [Campylobacter corcagiensis]